MSMDAVEMAVTDAGGEISASVEETNRVRASLGLAPLKEGNDGGPSKEAEAKANGLARAEAEAKEAAEEVRATRPAVSRPRQSPPSRMPAHPASRRCVPLPPPTRTRRCGTSWTRRGASGCSTRS